jgi:hypothetical protein
LCFGNVWTLPSLIFQHEFARASFGRLLGLSTAIGQVAYALIPTILGAVRDVAGGPRGGPVAARGDPDGARFCIEAPEFEKG